jgi:hypothetical protein
VVSWRFVSTSMSIRSVFKNWSNSRQSGWCLPTFKPPYLTPSPPIVYPFKNSHLFPYLAYLVTTTSSSSPSSNHVPTQTYTSTTVHPLIPNPQDPSPANPRPRPKLTCRALAVPHALRPRLVRASAWPNAHSCPVSHASDEYISPVRRRIFRRRVYIAHALGRWRCRHSDETEYVYSFPLASTTIPTRGGGTRFRQRGGTSTCRENKA